MVKAMVCTHRLSVQTTVVSRTVWLQSAMQVLTGAVSPQFGGRLYILPIVTTDLSIAVFAVLRLVTNRETEDGQIELV